MRIVPSYAMTEVPQCQSNSYQAIARAYAYNTVGIGVDTSALVFIADTTVDQNILTTEAQAGQIDEIVKMKSDINRVRLADLT